jgi:murein DD-endopeptidase MepM/ murein hydrolase activator NlpD
LSWTRRLFPERQILVRAEGRVSYITLTRRAQFLMAAGSTAVVAVLAYGLANPLYRASAPAPPPAPVTAAPGPDLQAEVTDLQRQLAAANARLAEQQSLASLASSKAAIDEAQAHIKALESARDQAIAEQQALQQQLAAQQEAASDRSQNLAQLNRTLESSRGELRQTDAQRQALQARVHQLEGDIDSANARTNQAKSDLAANERKLQQLAAEHEKITQERNRLQSQLSDLQSRSAAPPSNAGAAAAPPAAAATPPAAAAPSRSIADRPPDQHSENRRTASEIEQFLASTGIDVEKLIGRVAVAQNQGGPYIALDKTAKRLGEDDARNEELQKIIKTLPLAAPLPHYTIESGFGGRADPFTHKPGFHAGLDFAAPYRSPVYSTAPGTVVFAGSKTDYGKVVEVDHGHGFVTRYAHLHRVTVALGQKVTAHQQVGELGSTGRSTGPHLHYEVLVNGAAQDPEKFLQAGRNVVQTERE